jgi:hypothetical protein
MTPPQDGYQIAGMFLGYLGRFLLLIGLTVLLASIVLHTSLWPLGALLVLVSAFMWAIAYALSLPP